MSSPESGLPFVDEHGTVVAASREVVWAALRRYVATDLGVGERNPLAFVLGTRPRTGFELAQETPMREVSMVGHHHFSRYTLVFRLADTPEGHTVLTARTYAAFPGLHGRVYRALVIGSGAHVVATRRFLRAIRRLALEATDGRGRL